MDYKELIDRLRRRFLNDISGHYQMHSDICRDCNNAATAITDLLTRCERLNEARENANEACAKWEYRAKIAEKRAEKAEKERDAAVWWLKELGICGACSNTLCRERDGDQDCNFVFSGVGRNESGQKIS